jgi:hypothetical protein
LNAAQDIAPDGQRGPFPPTDATHTSTAVTSQGIFTRKKQHIRVKKTVSPWKSVFSPLGFALPVETPFPPVIFHSLLEGN